MVWGKVPYKGILDLVGWDIDINSNRYQRRGKLALETFIAVRPENPEVSDRPQRTLVRLYNNSRRVLLPMVDNPLPLPPLYLYRFIYLLPQLIRTHIPSLRWVLSLLSRPQSQRSPPTLAIVEIVVIVSIFSVVNLDRAAFRCAHR